MWQLHIRQISTIIVYYLLKVSLYISAVQTQLYLKASVTSQ